MEKRKDEGTCVWWPQSQRRMKQSWLGRGAGVKEKVSNSDVGGLLGVQLEMNHSTVLTSVCLEGTYRAQLETESRLF